MPKLLYFITEDWFFRSHFWDRAKRAQQAGFEVVVLAREVQMVLCFARPGSG